jgi:hypothetical protein
VKRFILAAIAAVALTACGTSSPATPAAARRPVSKTCYLTVTSDGSAMTLKVSGPRDRAGVPACFLVLDSVIGDFADDNSAAGGNTFDMTLAVPAAAPVSGATPDAWACGPPFPLDGATVTGLDTPDSLAVAETVCRTLKMDGQP